ncbi:hypothetical protein Tco_1225995 [Tanacetum coccineum]
MQKNWHSLQSIQKSSTNLSTTTFEPLQTYQAQAKDTTPRYNNDNQSGQFGNQRTMTVAGTRETVGSPVVQQTGIQCFNCKGFGHYGKEMQKPKRSHYSFMAKIQEVLPEESSSTEQPLEQVQNNDENNVFANERQHSENNTAECVDERVALANLIANLL